MVTHGGPLRDPDGTRRALTTCATTTTVSFRSCCLSGSSGCRTSRCVFLPPVPPAAHALSPCARLLPQAAVYADPASTARPGAPGAKLLAQLESVRQWDVKFRYNDRKKRALGGNGGTVAVGDDMTRHVLRMAVGMQEVGWVEVAGSQEEEMVGDALNLA